MMDDTGVAAVAVAWPRAESTAASSTKYLSREKHSKKTYLDLQESKNGEAPQTDGV